MPPSRTSERTHQKVRYQKLAQTEVHDNGEEWIELSEHQNNGDDNEEESNPSRLRFQRHRDIEEKRYPAYCKFVEFLLVILIVGVISYLLIRLLHRPWVEALERK